MGQTITQHTSGTALCPVLALAHIVHDILSNGGNKDTLLCSVHNGNDWKEIKSQQIILMVRDTARELKLHEQAIDPDLIRGALSNRFISHKPSK